MKTIFRSPVRVGLILSTLVALLAFAARLVEAQSPDARTVASHASIGAASPNHPPASTDITP